MTGPIKSLFQVAATSLLAVAPPPRVSSMLRSGRASGRRILSKRDSTDTSNNVVILGGGFGGLYTALRLHELGEGTGISNNITLVDTKDRFVFSPLLYELATGRAKDEEVAPFYSDLLANTGIRHMRGRVRSVNLASKNVELELSSETGAVGTNLPVGYDHLVVALGSESTGHRSEIPGVEEFCLPFYTVDDALKLRNELEKIKSTQGDRTVVIVGGGYIGVELASNISEALAESGTLGVVVRLLCGEKGLLPNAPQDFRSKAVHALTKAKVDICYNQQIREVQENCLKIKTSVPGEGGEEGGEESMSADVIVWTAGSQPNQMIRNSFPESTGDDGRLHVDDNMQVSEGVFALGDVSRLKKRVPASAQVVFQQSEYVAWNIWASITGLKKLNFQYTPLGDILALGGSNAAISGSNLLPDVKGHVGSFVRRATYAMRMPTNNQRKEALKSYFGSLIEK